MKPKMYYAISGVLFAAVAVIHVLRLARGWEVLIGGWSMPAGASVAGLIVSGYLAIAAFRLAKRAGV